MANFNKKFMSDSPIKQVAKGRVERLRARAKRRSERSGETGGYDYEDRKVLELLNKASRIEKRNNIKDSGWVKGGKGRKVPEPYSRRAFYRRFGCGIENAFPRARGSYLIFS